MRLTWPVVLLSIASALAQNWVNVAADNPRIHTVGRIWASDSQWNGGRCQTFTWSGTSATLSFEGSAVKAMLSKAVKSWGVDSSWYKVFVDGKHSKDIAFKDYNATKEIPLVEGLSAGVHTVTLYKRTEASIGYEEFCGFSYNGTEAIPTLKVPTRKLEFIGNSVTCGYGVLDECTVNTTTWGLDNCRPFTASGEDHYATYAAVAARILGAENQTLCWSGRGLYRNNKGDGSGPTMPQQWNFASRLNQYSDTNNAASWDYSRYIPDAVVIALGTNDFALGVPSETGFVSTYVRFIQTIQSKYGANVPFILLHGPMMSDGYPTGQMHATTLENYLDKVALQTNPQTVHKLVLTPTKSSEFGVGSDWHPNVKQNEFNAAELVAKLRSVLSWDAPGDSISSYVQPRLSQNSVALTYRSGSIQIQASIAGQYTLSIMDIHGRRLHKQEIWLSEGNNFMALPESSLKQGIRLVQINGMGLQESLMIVQ